MKYRSAEYNAAKVSRDRLRESTGLQGIELLPFFMAIDHASNAPQ